jgi:hypothetical protein
VDLQFQLGEEKTIVTSKIVVSPGAEGQNLTLRLLYCIFFHLEKYYCIPDVSCISFFFCSVFLIYTREVILECLIRGS